MKWPKWLSWGRKERELSDSGLWNAWNWGSMYLPTHAGKLVTPDNALRVSAVMACVRILSESLACMPVKIYERNGDRKTVADTYPLSYVLRWEPNPWQTPFEFIEMMQACLCLYGNAYAIIQAGDMGAVTHLVPVHPDLVRIDKIKNSHNYVYKIRNELGQETSYTQDQIFHVRGLSLDGICGISPIKYAKEAIGLQAAAEEYGASLFKNAGIPKVTLQTDLPMKTDEKKVMADMWTSQYGGEGNHNKTAVLSHGLKIAQLTLTPEDAQFLETRNFQSRDIARIFRVPLHLIGDLERATFSNIEQQSLEFVQYTMLPWVRRWEAAINRSLIADQDYFCEFTVEGLLRGDAQARATLYRELFNIGVYSVNDILSKENENAIGEEGDKRFVNGALIDLKMAGDPTLMNKNQAKPAQPPEAGATAPKTGKLYAKLSAMLSSQVEKMIRWEAKETARLAKDPSKFIDKLEEFHAEHQRRFLEALEPVCDAISELDEHDAAGDAEKAVLGHMEASKQLLLLACECKSEELPQKVTELVSKWPEERTKGVLKCLSF